MVQKKLPLINSEHGSETRNIINELIKLFNGMGYTYNESLNMARNILKDSQKINNMNSDVQRQLNEIILENGNSEAEVVQARGGNTVLNDRFIEHENVDEGIKRSVFNNSVTNRIAKKATLVFIDDDGRNTVYTRLKPVIEQEKIPFSSAIVTSRVGDSDILSLEQMKELQQIGFNFVSHTVTHAHIHQIPLEEADYELGESSRWLNAHGFDGNSAIVYPYGSQDEASRDVARKYYKMGVLAGTEKLNDVPVDQYRLERVYYNHPDGRNEVEHVKSKIDEAVRDDKLLIVGMHCHYQGFSQAGLIEIIQYAKSSGIDILSLEEVANTWSNPIDIKRKYDHIVVGMNGEGNIKDYTITNGLSSEIDVDTPISGYPKGKTITVLHAGLSNSGFPENSQGIVETLRTNSDTYGYQSYYPYLNSSYVKSSKYYRHWNEGGKTWGPWQKVYNNILEETSPPTALGDWDLQLKTNKEGNLSNITGRIIAVTTTSNYDIATIPLANRPLENALIPAFNHTTGHPVNFVLFTSGILRLLDSTNITSGDSIRINYTYMSRS